MTGKRTTTALLLVLGAAVACDAGDGRRGDDAAVEAPAAAPSSVDAIDSGEALLAAMHRAYDDRWYETLSFKQRVVRTPPGGEAPSVEVWTEYVALPGLLRIDLADGYGGDGVVYRADSLYVFRDGELATARAERNPLLVLAFDVYGQPPEETSQVLEGLGFDLSLIRRDTWEGRPSWVVGAAEGDTTSRQFWVDEERLVFTRLIQPSQDGSSTTEIRFEDYEPLAGGWIAPTVRFLTDGREMMREEYFDVEAGPELDAALFDPEAWGPPGVG